MRISFPAGIDRLGLLLSQAEHNVTTQERTVQQTDLSQAIQAVQRKVGIDNSTDMTSIDYRLRTVEAAAGIPTAVDLTGIEARLLVVEAAAASSVSGTGSSGRLAYWSASNIIGSGPITVSGSDVVFDGHASPAVNNTTNLGSSSYRWATAFMQTLDVNGPAQFRASLYALNKAGSAWLTFATRNTAGTEAVLNLAHIDQITPTANTNVLQVNGTVLASGGYFFASRNGSTFALLQNQSTTQASRTNIVVQMKNSVGTYKDVAFIAAENSIYTSGAETGSIVMSCMNAGAAAAMAMTLYGTQYVSITGEVRTSAGFLAGATMAGGVSNMLNNWNGNVGLLLRRTGTGTGRPIVAQNSSSADLFEVSADGSVVSQGDVKAGSGKKLYIGTAPQIVIESATSRAPAAAPYDGGIGVNTNSSRSRALIRANSTWREVVTGHWERKKTDSVSAATGVTLTFANAYIYGHTAMPLAFWEDADGNLNWCRVVRTLDEGTNDLLAVTAYPAEDGATVHIFMFEPDATQ